MFKRNSRIVILLRTLMIALLIGGCRDVLAQDDPVEKVSPRIAMCIPLAVPCDATTKVIVRGWGLEGANEVRSSNPQLIVKILSSAKATIPSKQDAKQIGDTEIELEITVAKDVKPGEVELTIVQPKAESQPHKLLVGGSPVFGSQALVEKEPNDGFTQAQPLLIPQILDGQIQGDGNVDVFFFELNEKKQVFVEVHANRYGSNLDSILTLFDQRGNIVAVNDDADETKDTNGKQSSKDVLEMKDSKIIVALPAGKYFISLQDAHDRGGPAHPYRLTVATDDTF